METDTKLETSFSSFQQKAAISTKLTAGYLATKQSKFLMEFDLSMAQFNILRILRVAGEPITVNSIKSRMVELSPNTTRLLDKMLDKKLITKKNSNYDRRKSLVVITDYGLDILNQIDNSNFSSILIPNRLSNEDAEQLCTLLERLRHAF